MMIEFSEKIFEFGDPMYLEKCGRYIYLKFYDAIRSQSELRAFEIFETNEEIESRWKELGEILDIAKVEDKLTYTSLNYFAERLEHNTGMLLRVIDDVENLKGRGKSDTEKTTGLYAWEALKALHEGKKIRHKDWKLIDEKYYVYFNFKDLLYMRSTDNEHDQHFHFNDYECNWEIVE